MAVVIYCLRCERITDDRERPIGDVLCVECGHIKIPKYSGETLRVEGT